MKKKGDGFLKFIIVYKVVLGAAEVAVGLSLYKHFGADIEEALTVMAVNLNLDADNRFIGAVIGRAGMMGSGMMKLMVGVILFLGVLNFFECAGLYLRQRWAEWTTVFTTGVFIPFEVYELLDEITIFRTVILVINIAVVYYLAKHKELFGRDARLSGARSRHAHPARSRSGSRK